MYLIKLFIRVMKLASTNLNYLIIVGSYWLYINTFFIVIPERENHLELYEALVNVSGCLYTHVVKPTIHRFHFPQV
jgi:hypothetical protein